jgi:formate C-acetyltransferase
MHLGYDTLIQKGISGLIKDVEERKAALDIGDPDFVKKMSFYNSCRIVCDAYAIFAERYAAHAEKLETDEEDEAIRSGYQKAAEVCRNVGSGPAKTFHEALQMIWFAQVLAIIESGLPPFGFGRMDQYLYPYYAQDIKAGIITREEGQELLDSFWIKAAESTYLREKGMNRYLAGQPVGQQLNIGGVDENGQDATNELSYMMIQATMNTRLIQPSLGILWHRDMPDDLAQKAVELTSLGTGHPSHYSSDTMIRMLKKLGLTEKEARQGCMVGCVEPAGKQGTSLNHNSAGGINLGLVVDLVFTDGVSRMSNERIGMQTGDPCSFDSFEKVVEAFEKQMYFAQKLFALWANTSSKANENFPLPFESLLMPHCIETGVDLVDGGARYNFPPAATIIGIADFIDSIIAVNYLIFDKKEITWDQLIHALNTNFEDMETNPNGPEIRQMCLAAPKYGNDDDYVDELAIDLMKIIPDLMERFSNESGNPIRPGIVPVSSYVPAGLAVGALPSGRKAGERLADGCSPKQGMDRQGPTAVIRSLTRWSHDGYTNGTQFNMKFTPSSLKDQAGLKKFADLIKVFTKNGGHHVQFNVVSSDVLKSAQSHPEKYPGLMVRVAGYSAYFIDLDVDVQNDIISRTELSL